MFCNVQVGEVVAGPARCSAMCIHLLGVDDNHTTCCLPVLWVHHLACCPPVLWVHHLACCLPVLWVHLGEYGALQEVRDQA